MFDGQNEFSQIFTGNNDNITMDIDVNMTNSNAMSSIGQMTQGSVSAPIIEPMQERVINRTIMHEVQHVCPIRTKIINNHVYRHTYSPAYTCCEENTCTNIQCGSCCCFNNR
ncbi:MAG: hypothetical protein IJ568_07915 [Bacilli bacterium]|nr:hypothetical protein [Bacilli bacterium]